MTKAVKILSRIGWLLGAVLLSPLIAIGFIYDLFYEVYKKRFKSFLLRFLDLTIEMCMVTSWLIGRLAIGIDMIGNIMCGNLILHFCTNGYIGNHLFRLSGVTISAALGQLITHNNDQINKKGRWVIGVLDLFEKNHCLLAYHIHLHNLEITNLTHKLRYTPPTN